MKTCIFRTDWLASRPVFYNESTGKASENINDVIDAKNLEFDAEGFNNYLDFGYSVLGQSPLKHVKSLRYSSKLWQKDNGELEVECLNDPIEKWIDYRLSESELIDLIRGKVQRWEQTLSEKIVLPLSGGYDSRLLSWCLQDKSRISAFTYGLSEAQVNSFEAIYARELASVQGIEWKQIFLGDYHHYFQEWDELYGVSTHAHGMYQIEFYKKILFDTNKGMPLLSGIFGDVWAGSTCPTQIRDSKELKELGYSHGLNADSRKSKIPCDYRLREEFFLDNKEKLVEERYRVISQVRFKMILISYLLTVPKSMGFEPWSPFLEIDVAMAMLNIPLERRRDRLWQQDFFRQVGLDFEAKSLKVSRQNNLNHQAMRRLPVVPLCVDLLEEVIEPHYIDWINSNVRQQGLFWDWFWYMTRVPKIRRMARYLRLEEERLPAYHAYLTLKPVENLLRKRG